MKPRFAVLFAALLTATLLSSVCLVRAQNHPSTTPAVAASAQQTSPPAKNPDDQIQLLTDLVSVKVTVADSFGRVVAGLKRDHFEVYDDKVKQQIAHFTEADAPISIGIIYDVSGSMGGIIGHSLLALRRFVETSHEDDDFFLIAFSRRAELVQDFTTSGDQVLGRLSLVKPKGATALYDAVYLGVEKVQQGRHKKRALLVISDGEENSSRYSYRELRKQVREADVQIYAINIGWRYGIGAGVLSEIADLAGGRAFTPGDKGLDFLDICTRIALELRHQYSLGFYPSDARAPIQWHRVQVKLNAPKGLGRVTLTYKERYETFKK